MFHNKGAESIHLQILMLSDIIIHIFFLLSKV